MGVLLSIAPVGATASEVSLAVWGLFVAGILVLLVVDLKVVMRDPGAITTRVAAVYSGVWIALGVLFGGLVWVWLGGDSAAEYITGYLIEKSLSVDNVFLWAVLFGYFAVPQEQQHRVLFWGIFGALVFRAIFIFGGVALLNAFHGIVFVFAAFLLFTAYKVGTQRKLESDPEENLAIRIVHRWVPSVERYHGERFFVRRDGGLRVTPLMTALVAIELTDVMFAVDSIPAILSVTRNEFIVFSSNAFAVLGLRALYFLLAGFRDRFVYLNQGLGVILAFVGAKFVVDEFWHVPIWLSLAFIAAVLTVTVVASFRAAPERARGGDGDGAPGGDEATDAPGSPPAEDPSSDATTSTEGRWS